MKKLIDSLNERSVDMFLSEVEAPEYLLLSHIELEQLKDEYKELYREDITSFSLRDIEELLGFTICVTASKRNTDGITFLKKV